MPTQRSTDLIWTVLDLIKWGTDYFRERGIDSPRLTMELMLCAVLSTSRIKLYADFDRPLMADELAMLRSMVRRRAHHEPLQYILGEAHFYSLTFEVTPETLIPRPETELLVEQCIRFIKESGSTQSCLDIGTGSGIIPITIAAHTPGSNWTCIDISKGALEVAQRNAERHGVADRCSFVRTDFLRDTIGESFDVITMNPPYIPAKEVADLQEEVRDYEPHSALTDDADGLTFYRHLAKQLPTLLNPGGAAFVELGWGRVDDVKGMFDATITAKVIDDLSSIPRVLCLFGSE